MKLVSEAQAQIKNPAISSKYGSGEGATILGNLVSDVLSLLIVVAGIASLIYFMIGAVRWITAGADKNRLQQAQDQIIHAVVGLIVVAAAWAIMTIVSNLLGLDIIGSGATGGSAQFTPTQ